MSGHSKWSQIRRQKGVNDARRGQLFTKLAREITVAAREGGGDPDANFRLRLAIQKARESNMPAENIQRAIARGTGAGEGGHLEEIVYEGYGPGGAAIMVEALTDSRNRTIAEMRNTFARNGGNLGETGSVSWMFEPHGVILIACDGRNPEEIELAAIDAGASDVTVDGDHVTVLTEPQSLDAVRVALAGQFPIADAESTVMPRTTVELDPTDAVQVMKLVEKLEDLDDVQRVHTNVDFPDELLDAYASAAAR